MRKGYVSTPKGDALGALYLFLCLLILWVIFQLLAPLAPAHAAGATSTPRPVGTATATRRGGAWLPTPIDLEDNYSIEAARRFTPVMPAWYKTPTPYPVQMTGVEGSISAGFSTGTWTTLTPTVTAMATARRATPTRGLYGPRGSTGTYLSRSAYGY